MIYTERRDNMELVKSKGMVIFLIMVLSITIISSIGNKKIDKASNAKSIYVSLNNN